MKIQSLKLCNLGDLYYGVVNLGLRYILLPYICSRTKYLLLYIVVISVMSIQNLTNSQRLAIKDERKENSETWTIDDSEFKEAGIRVRDLMFYVNTGCDLRCRHCYVGNKWLNSAFQFSTNEAIKLIDHFAKSGLDRLTFLGGEPTQHSSITSLIERTRGYMINEKRMTTNGVELKYLDLNRVKPSDFNHISISFEGHTAKLHDYIRGQGAFEKALMNLKKLQNLGFRVHVTFTVMRTNIDSLESAIQFFQSIGITEMNFHLLSPIGNASKFGELDVRPKEWVDVRKKLENLSSIHDIKLRIPLMFVTKEEYQKVSQDGYLPFQTRSYHCPDGGNRIVLYPNGKVYMSCDLTGTDFNFAFFEDGKFKLKYDVNELTLLKENPAISDPSAILLNKFTENLIPLSISYKETIAY